MHGVFATTLAYSLNKDIEGSISAIAAVPSKQLLILGTSTGYLYTIDVSSQVPILLHSISICKRSLDQILPIASLDLLLILTDGNVHSFSIATLKERDALPSPTKSNLLAVHCSSDSETFPSNDDNRSHSSDADYLSHSKGDVLLTIASKRTLWLGRWQEGGWIGAIDLALPHQIRSITFTRSPSTNDSDVNSSLRPSSIFLGFSTSEFGIVSLSDPNKPVLSPLFTLPSSLLSTSQITNDASIMSSSASVTSTTADSYARAGLRLGLSGLVRLGPMKVAKNSVIAISDSEVIIIRDNYGVFLSSDGRQSRPERIEYPEPPDEIVIKGQFIIAHISTVHSTITKQPPNDDESKHNRKGSTHSFQSSLGPFLYVHSLTTLQLVQIISIPSLRNHILFPDVDHTAVESLRSRLDFRASHLCAPCRSDDSPIFVTITPIKKITSTWGSSEQNLAQSVIKLDLIPGNKQFDEMVENGDCLEAIALLDNPGILTFTNSEEKRTRARSIYGVHLMYRELKFDSSIDVFINLETNPAKVVSLFPEVISGRLYINAAKRLEMFGVLPKIDDDDYLRKSTDDDKNAAVTNITDADNNFANISSQQTSEQENGDRNVGNSQDHDHASKIRTAQKNNGGTETSDAYLKQEVIDSSGMNGKSPTRQTFDDECFKDKALFRQMVDALIRYLTDRRQKILKAISTFSTKKPTIMCDSIPKLTPEQLREFPDLPISSLNDATNILVFAQIIDTALFRSYLATKPIMLGPLCRLENWCEIEEVEGLLLDNKKYRELLDLYNGKQQHEKALALLQKTSEDEDDPELKVQPAVSYLQKLGPRNLDLILDGSKWIYSVYPRMVIQVFVADHEQVEALPRHAVAAHLEKLDAAICAEFLEHNINVLNEDSPEFHEKLIEIYLLLAAKEDKNVTEEVSEDMKYSQKLLQFLEDSQQYRADRLIAKSWTNTMPEVRAILLGRLGQHEGALQIYVNRIKTYLKAEEYCKRVYARNKEEGSEVFFMLIHIYLKPKSHNAKPQLDEALNILSRHAPKMDMSRVLDLLPANITIKQLSEFLTRSVRSDVETQRKFKMQKEILQANISDLGCRLVDLRGQRIKLEETRTCPHCRKRLGNSVLAIHPPNGEPTHYHCRLPYIENRSKTS